VIGRGFGGLAAAVRLCAKGWRVQVLEKFAGSATLWLRFINYIKGNQSRFSVSKVRATYTTAIKRTLSGSGGIVNSDSVAKAEQSALLIFRDLAEFERCCGYTERALSLWHNHRRAARSPRRGRVNTSEQAPSRLS
jgi:choline dehydrogenase-like flavoprotein